MSRGVRIRKRGVHGAALLGCALSALALVGFVQIRFTSSSPGFKWPITTVRFAIQERGSDDVTDLSDEAAIRLAFRSWEQVPDSFMRFSEDTFADRSRTDYTSTDIHLVMWDEDGTTGLFPEGSNVIALTPVLASTTDGTILDADIVFNGQLRFTTDPGREAARFDVQAVTTHEVGHFIGFDHSGGTFSTMFASIPSGTTYARSLELDDYAAAATLYGSGASTRGTVSGTIGLQGGGSTRFVQVVAVKATTGVVAGQALSDDQGSYSIQGLEPGSYDLYVEPVNGPYGLADTIGFKTETSSSFPTTFNPANPVTVSAGQTLAASWTVPNQAPALNVSATSAGQVTVGNNAALALVGTGLDKVDSVEVSGSSVLVSGLTGQSATGLIVSISANAGAATGIRNLILRTGSGEVAVVTAGVDVIEPFPIVNSVSPTTLRAQGGDNVTVTGSRFTEGSQVVIGGKLATGINVAQDGASLTCVAPTSPGTTDPVDVVVIRPDGREARGRGAVSYEAAPVPTAVDPAVGPVVGGTIHEIKGGGFVQPLQVTIGGTNAEVLSVTSDVIKIRLPGHAAGQVDVVVVASGKEGLLQGGFTYVDATAPNVESLTPDRGSTGGGTSVTIQGSGFADTSQVRFDGIQATLTSSSPNQLVVTTPAHAAGQVQVRVTNPSSGLATVSATPFTYDDTPPPPPSSSGGDDCRIGLEAHGGGPALALLLLVLFALRLTAPAARSPLS